MLFAASFRGAGEEEAGPGCDRVETSFLPSSLQMVQDNEPFYGQALHVCLS